MLMKTNPFTLLRQMASDMDRIFAAAPRPLLGEKTREFDMPTLVNWVPGLDVFEKNGQLVTRIDLPGMRKEDVKVEVADGHLAISGERQSEVEEKTDQFYRREREYGQFYRAVPLPEGVKLEEIKAVFADGVLEVSVPLPIARTATVRRITVENASKEVETAA